jgi:hypothetical protein
MLTCFGTLGPRTRLSEKLHTKRCLLCHATRRTQKRRLLSKNGPIELRSFVTLRRIGPVGQDDDPIDGLPVTWN